MTIRLSLASDLNVVTDIARRAYEPYVALIGKEPAPMNENYAARIASDAVWLFESGRGDAQGFIVFNASHLLHKARR